MKNNLQSEKNKKNNLKHPLIFILPAFLGCLIFIFIPSVFSFLLSFCNWNLLNEIRFVALDNYIELFNSKEFWFILKNTIVYALSVTVFGTIIPLVLASIVNEKIKGKEFFKTAYFIPFITPMIVIAMIWQWFFDPNIGFINGVFKTNINWLYSRETALPVLIFVSVWKLIGYNMVIFLSGFSQINAQMFEAAKTDGATDIKTFFYITIPQLSPTILFVMLITTISSFQVFDLIYLMTQGGPGNATNVLVYWLYNCAFETFDTGKASAVAYILFVFIFILTIGQWNLRKFWVKDETDS